MGLLTCAAVAGPQDMNGDDARLLSELEVLQANISDGLIAVAWSLANDYATRETWIALPHADHEPLGTIRGFKSLSTYDSSHFAVCSNVRVGTPVKWKKVVQVFNKDGEHSAEFEISSAGGFAWPFYPDVALPGKSAFLNSSEVHDGYSWIGIPLEDRADELLIEPDIGHVGEVGLRGARFSPTGSSLLMATFTETSSGLVRCDADSNWRCVELRGWPRPPRAAAWCRVVFWSQAGAGVTFDGELHLLDPYSGSLRPVYSPSKRSEIVFGVGVGDDRAILIEADTSGNLSTVFRGDALRLISLENGATLGQIHVPSSLKLVGVAFIEGDANQ